MKHCTCRMLPGIKEKFDSLGSSVIRILQQIQNFHPLLAYLSIENHTSSKAVFAFDLQKSITKGGPSQHIYRPEDIKHHIVDLADQDTLLQTSVLALEC